MDPESVAKKPKFDAAARFGLTIGDYPSYQPANCPFETIFIDVTHRCNMACRNCYIPNRHIPDLDAKWLAGIFAQLPRGRFIRLVGAEPTMREDLPELIRSARAAGHHPMILSNGLKLADRDYLRSLKVAGLAVAYLSLNGAFDDALYKKIDGMYCAAAKQQAFENLKAEHIYTSLGMIIVRGINEHALADLWQIARTAANVREVHFRAVGAIGRYLKNAALSLAQLQDLLAAALAMPMADWVIHERTANSIDLKVGKKRIQLTQWPDMGSLSRGRLTPEGLIAPAFEHVVNNEGGY